MVHKIFTYLDGGGFEGDDAYTVLHRNDNQRYNGERINFKYFDVEFKKKGTVHIWLTRDDLLKKFNIFGGQKHNFLPNSYGKKKYKEMTKEEQEVIDSFEGEKSYNETVTNSQFYLGGNSLLMLE